MHGSLATRLRVLRAERGLTVRQVAEMSGVAKETISQIERGERHPYDRTLAKLAQAYDVPVEELIEEPVLAAGGPGKAEAPVQPPGPSLLKKGVDAARRDKAKDVQAVNRLVASEGTLKATAASGYAEDEYRAELRALGFPDEYFEDFIWPAVLEALRAAELEEELAQLKEGSATQSGVEATDAREEISRRV